MDSYYGESFDKLPYDLLHMIVGYISDDFADVLPLLEEFGHSVLKSFPLVNCNISADDWWKYKTTLHRLHTPRNIVNYNQSPSGCKDINQFFLSTPYLKTLSFGDVIIYIYFIFYFSFISVLINFIIFNVQYLSSFPQYLT